MQIKHDVIAAIGGTPLIRLRQASEATGCEILGKAEFLNPGQSVKDRAALFIIQDAIRRGRLRPGGTIVASDSDFGFVVVEPLSPEEVRELFAAAAPAFREPNVGRKLRGAYRRAGLEQVRVEVNVAPDERGNLRGVLENMLGYGTRFGRMSEARADELRVRLDAAIAEGTFLMALPQWWVRGVKA